VPDETPEKTPLLFVIAGRDNAGSPPRAPKDLVQEAIRLTTVEIRHAEGREAAADFLRATHCTVLGVALVELGP